MNEDITRVSLPGKEVILVGTAHISQQSVDIVRQVIEAERPDVVCVELDEQRARAMEHKQAWDELDLKQIIRQKKLMFLMARLALGSFQKKMGSYTGVSPGAEMLAAMEVARAQGAQLVLCDRDVSVTLLRAWRTTPWWKRAMLVASLFGGVFERTEISEEELKKLREQHNLGSMLDEMGEAMPEVKGVLVDERDTYMSHEIQQAPGEKIVVVIGAAHKPGITAKLPQPVSAEEVAQMVVVPPKSTWGKVLPWVLPLIVLGLFVFGFTRGDTEALKDAALAWVLANGLLSALGTLLALGHPLTIIAAFIAAPITSLNPTVGAGMVTALVQVWVAPPKVRDMERAGDDIMETKGWWTNRLTRVLLVFVFSSIGSSVGTFVALGFFKDLLD